MYKLNLQNLNESGSINQKLQKKFYTLKDLRNLKFKNYPF